LRKKGKGGGRVSQHFLSFFDVCLIRGLECDGWKPFRQKKVLILEKKILRQNFNLIKRRRNHFLSENKKLAFKNKCWLLDFVKEFQPIYQ